MYQGITEDSVRFQAIREVDALETAITAYKQKCAQLAAGAAGSAQGQGSINVPPVTTAPTGSFVIQKSAYGSYTYTIVGGNILDIAAQTQQQYTGVRVDQGNYSRAINGLEVKGPDGAPRIYMVTFRPSNATNPFYSFRVGFTQPGGKCTIDIGTYLDQGKLKGNLPSGPGCQAVPFNPPAQ